MSHSSIATDKQVEYLIKLHGKHHLPIPAEVEEGTISKKDASALIEALKNYVPATPAPTAKKRPNHNRPVEPYQVRLYKMLVDMENELVAARSNAIDAVERVQKALDRMAPTLKSLYPYVDKYDQDLADYEEFLDDNKPELNYDVKTDVYLDDDFTTISTESCPF